MIIYDYIQMKCR